MTDFRIVPKEIPSELLAPYLNFLSAERNYQLAVRSSDNLIEVIDAGFELEDASEKYHKVVNELMKKTFKRGK